MHRHTHAHTYFQNKYSRLPWEYKTVDSCQITWEIPGRSCSPGTVKKKTFVKSLGPY